jgi:immunoglobulin heavy chain|uniref:Immunoglobulin V-set domain-containing protein n=1 Tax=Castor canadensis TaxID=51338 RepID=A0A8C0W283_CASCN
MGIDAFCFLTTGVHTQVLLEQPGAEVRKPEPSVKFCCNISEFTYTSYSMHLVRQSPKHGLEWINRMHPEYNETIYIQNFQSSLTLTVDMSSITAFMELSRLRADHSAVYYCVRYTV